MLTTKRAWWLCHRDRPVSPSSGAHEYERSSFAADDRFRATVHWKMLFWGCCGLVLSLCPGYQCGLVDDHLLILVGAGEDEL